MRALFSRMSLVAVAAGRARALGLQSGLLQDQDEQLVIVSVNAPADAGIESCRLFLRLVGDESGVVETKALANNTIVIEAGDTADGYELSMTCSNLTLSVVPHVLQISDQHSVLRGFELNVISTQHSSLVRTGGWPSLESTVIAFLFVLVTAAGHLHVSRPRSEQAGHPAADAVAGCADCSAACAPGATSALPAGQQAVAAGAAACPAASQEGAAGGQVIQAIRVDDLEEDSENAAELPCLTMQGSRLATQKLAEIERQSKTAALTLSEQAAAGRPKCPAVARHAMPDVGGVGHDDSRNALSAEEHTVSRQNFEQAAAKLRAMLKLQTTMSLSPARSRPGQSDGLPSAATPNSSAFAGSEMHGQAESAGLEIAPTALSSLTRARADEARAFLRAILSRPPPSLQAMWPD